MLICLCGYVLFAGDPVAVTVNFSDMKREEWEAGRKLHDEEFKKGIAKALG